MKSFLKLKVNIHVFINELLYHESLNQSPRSHTLANTLSIANFFRVEVENQNIDATGCAHKAGRCGHEMQAPEK